MNKIKKWMIILIILMIVLIGTIVVLKLSLRQSKTEENTMTREESFQKVNQLQKINDKIEWIQVQNCLNKYGSYSDNLQIVQKIKESGEILEEKEEEYNKRIEQQLIHIIPEFVQETLKITQENIYEKIGTKDEIVRINNIYKSVQTASSIPYEETTNICAYIVEGVFIKKEDGSKRDFNMVVLLDYVSNTFAILPDEYIKEEKLDLYENENIQLYDEELIEKNDDNTFSMISNVNEEMCQKYFANYKESLIYDAEFAFTCLQKEYATKRFGQLDNFKNYIQKNGEEISQAELKKYQVNNYNDYTEYVCVDQFGNLYIFKEEAVLNFTLQLDTYTIPTENFIKNYQAKNEQNKVMMNIDKWVQMLNNRDYRAAYSVIDETYRENTFGSQEEFEEIMREKLPLHYQVEYNSFSDENGTYIQNINLTDIEAESEDIIQMTIIMQLKDDLDFVMSCSFE